MACCLVSAITTIFHKLNIFLGRSIACFGGAFDVRKGDSYPSDAFVSCVAGNDFLAVMHCDRCFGPGVWWAFVPKASIILSQVVYCGLIGYSEMGVVVHVYIEDASNMSSQ